MHYIRTLPFTRRQVYAQTVRNMGPCMVPLVISCSKWFVTDFMCLIVHREQTLRQLLVYLESVASIPSNNTCTFDAVSKRDYSLDTKVQDLEEKEDLTRYVHFIVV